MQLLSKHFWYSFLEKLPHYVTQPGIKDYAGVFLMFMAFTNCQKFWCKQWGMKGFLVITFLLVSRKFRSIEQIVAILGERGYQKKLFEFSKHGILVSLLLL